MSYAASTIFSVGSYLTGLTDLRVQPLTAASVPTGPAITTGFVEQGQGLYGWSGSVPDNTAAVRLTSAGTPAVLAVEPTLTSVIAAKVTGWQSTEGQSVDALAPVVRAQVVLAIAGTEAKLPTTPPAGYGVAASTGAYPLTVTVTDGTAAVEGAFVRATANGQPTATGTTSSAGTAVLSLDAGTYTLSVTAGGFMGASQSLVVAGQDTVSVALQRSAPVTVTPGQSLGDAAYDRWPGATQAGRGVHVPARRRGHGRRRRVAQPSAVQRDRQQLRRDHRALRHRCGVRGLGEHPGHAPTAVAAPHSVQDPERIVRATAAVRLTRTTPPGELKTRKRDAGALIW